MHPARPLSPVAAATAGDDVGHESPVAALGSVPVQGDFQHADFAANDDEWLRLPAVQHLVPLSESRIYTLMKAGRFPRPRPIGSRAVAWSRRAIEAWLRDVAVERECRDAGIKTGKRGPLPKMAGARLSRRELATKVVAQPASKEPHAKAAISSRKSAATAASTQ